MGDLQLYSALRDGDLELVQALLEDSCSDVNSLLGLHGTPLCAAISAGHNHIITYMVQLPACDVNAKDFDGEPPVCLAIRKKNKYAVELLLARPECDLNKPDPVSGNPPISVAVVHEFPAAVKMLLDAGCDVNQTATSGDTPLHLAITKKSLVCLQFILSSKQANVNKINANGLCPIHVAAACIDVSLLETLLEMCVIIQDEDSTELAANHLALNKVATLTGNTALHVAVQEQNAEAVLLLIERSPQVDITNYQDQTPLFLACESNRFDMAETLLKCGADPKIMCCQKKTLHCYVTKRSRSPLHLCVLYGNYLLVTQLSDYGADLNSQDENGETPLHYALSRNKLDIANFLLSDGIQRGCDVNLTDIHGNTPLFCVSHCMQARALTQKLLRLGCSVTHTNARGKTALHAALEMDCSEVVEVLLDNGAPVDSSNDGYTLLHVCALEDLAHMARVLLFFGADMYMKTPDGEMALRLALEHNSYDVLQVLLQGGFNVSKEEFLQNADNLPFALVDDESLRQHIFDLSMTPPRLLTQCRQVVRDHFKMNSLKMKTMRHLPLPKKLKDFMLLKMS